MTTQTRNALKSGMYTALWTFIALFGTALLGWLGDLIAWASSDGAVVAFPDTTVLVKAAVAAVGAALSGLVALIVRLAQAATGRGSIPQYPVKPLNEQGGQAIGTVLVVILIVLLIVVLL